MVYVNAIGYSMHGFYLFKGRTRLQNYIIKCEPHTSMDTHPHFPLISYATLQHLYWIGYPLETGTCLF